METFTHQCHINKFFKVNCVNFRIIFDLVTKYYNQRQSLIQNELMGYDEVIKYNKGQTKSIAGIFLLNNTMQNLSFNNLQIQPSLHQLPPMKMDILFYESIARLQQSYSLMALYQLIKALLFIIFIPIDYTIINHPNSPDILAVMIFALIVSVLQMASVILFRFIVLRDNNLFLRVAQQMQHVTHQPIRGSIDQVENCVSATIFNQQNGTLVTDQGLTEQIKNMYLNYLTSNIKEILVSSAPNIKKYDYFAEFSGLVSLVASIVVLAKAQSNTSELDVIVTYIILEGLTKLMVIIFALLLALSPLYCLLMIFCMCCCGRGQDQGQLKMPATQKATQKMILQADGTCSICYQNFIVEESVVRLKCSPKHMFHPFCISGWAKLKETCPICRASIRELANSNYRENQ